MSGYSRSDSVGVTFYGNWPSQVSAFFPREKTDTLATEIKNLCCRAKAGALVVHGCGGVGKTTMVVFGVRRIIGRSIGTSEFGSVQFVFWLNVSKLSIKFEESDFNEQILEMFRNSGIMLPDSEPTCQSIKASIDKIGARVLFIFDDVFNIGVLRCTSKFGTNVRAVALTRNLSRAKFNSDSYCCSDFQIDKWSPMSLTEMLADFYGLREKGLHPEKQIPKLASICQGLPLVASVVASHFRRLQSEKHIYDCFWLLVNNCSEVSRTDVPVDKFGDEDEIHLQISKVVTFSPELDDEHVRRRLYSLLLFQYGETITANEMAVIWNCQSIDEATELCRELTEASLMQISEQGYYMHDLLRKALVDKALKEGSEKDELQLKKQIMQHCLESETTNVIAQAIEYDCPEVLELMIELAPFMKLRELLKDKSAMPLMLLAGKITSDCLWLKNVATKTETSAANELFCRLFEIRGSIAHDAMSFLARMLSFGRERYVSESHYEIELRDFLASSLSTQNKPWYQNMFFVAIRCECIWLLNLFIDGFGIAKNILEKQRDAEHNSPLIFALKHATTKSAAHLINAGIIDFNARNIRDETALWHCTVLPGIGLEIAKQLFKLATHSKLEVDVPDAAGATPLNQAIRQGNLAMVQFLVETMHADLSLPSPTTLATPLDTAILLRQYAIDKTPSDKTLLMFLY